MTSLFSALAFAGLIVTILLQREELQLQREEMSANRSELKKSIENQEKTARISAISILLEEYGDRLKDQDSESKDDGTRKKNDLINELELIVASFQYECGGNFAKGYDQDSCFEEIKLHISSISNFAVVERRENGFFINIKDAHKGQEIYRYISGLKFVAETGES